MQQPLSRIQWRSISTDFSHLNKAHIPRRVHERWRSVRNLFSRLRFPLKRRLAGYHRVVHHRQAINVQLFRQNLIRPPRLISKTPSEQCTPGFVTVRSMRWRIRKKTRPGNENWGRGWAGVIDHSIQSRTEGAKEDLPLLGKNFRLRGKNQTLVTSHAYTKQQHIVPVVQPRSWIPPYFLLYLAPHVKPAVLVVVP